MEQAYAIEYRELYQRHWWWRSREAFIMQTLCERFGKPMPGNQPVDALPPNQSRQILDIGCGDGLFFDKLQTFGQVTGVEGDPNTMTPNGQWQNHIHCQWFDKTFRPSNQFDAILMLDILEHMHDPIAALQHARSLLKPNGFLVATVPAFPQLWTSHDDLNHHEIRYTKATFLPLIEQVGFELDAARYLYHWTCPAKLAIRLKESLFGATPKPPMIPPSWLNSVCFALSKLEQLTLSRLPMPFGSSLMVVAR